MNLRPIRLIVLLLVPSPSLPLSARELWHALYDGRFGTGDVAFAVTIDAGGKVYVTGGSGTGEGGRDSGWATVCYDRNGGLVWDVRLDSERRKGEMAGRDIALDGKGNVHVVGWIAGQPGALAVAKYDARGRELWVATYIGPGRDSNTGCRVALDEDGHVYVAGYASRAGWENSDYVTLRYGPDGALQWAATYDGPAGGLDYMADLALDADGGVYVTGASEDRGLDYATVKYSPEGEELWVRRYDGDGPFAGDDRAAGIAVDPSGSIYVAGTSPFFDDDYLVLKYDRDGNQEWEARYDSGVKDTAQAMVCDRDGSVYVTGWSSSESEDYATVKLDSSGRELWSAVYDGPDEGRGRAEGIALDGQGRVYVTGTENSRETTREDAVTVCYGARGEELWVARYAGTLERSPDRAYAVTSDARGSVYIAGYSAGDYLVVKYATTLWRRGDVNADGRTNLTDAVTILEHLFRGEEESTCAKSADANDDSSVNLADAVFLLSHLFGAGAAIPEPSSECGIDPIDEGLACTSFEGCS